MAKNWGGHIQNRVILTASTPLKNNIEFQKIGKN